VCFWIRSFSNKETHSLHTMGCSLSKSSVEVDAEAAEETATPAFRSPANFNRAMQVADSGKCLGSRQGHQTFLRVRQIGSYFLRPVVCEFEIPFHINIRVLLEQRVGPPPTTWDSSLTHFSTSCLLSSHCHHLCDYRHSFPAASHLLPLPPPISVGVTVPRGSQSLPPIAVDLRNNLTATIRKKTLLLQANDPGVGIRSSMFAKLTELQKSEDEFRLRSRFISSGGSTSSPGSGAGQNPDTNSKMHVGNGSKPRGKSATCTHMNETHVSHSVVLRVGHAFAARVRHACASHAFVLHVGHAFDIGLDQTALISTHIPLLAKRSGLPAHIC
jgi:hypothetical protein